VKAELTLQELWDEAKPEIFVPPAGALAPTTASASSGPQALPPWNWDPPPTPAATPAPTPAPTPATNADEPDWGQPEVEGDGNIVLTAPPLPLLSTDSPDALDQIARFCLLCEFEGPSKHE
jgi:hypothetical protein